jgi:hypothetical protein
MLTFKDIKVSDQASANEASRYPENEHELGFASKVEAIGNYYGGAHGSVPHNSFDDRALWELGLERGKPITAEQRANMLLGKNAGGTKQLVKAKNREVSGYDCTFSVDKSLSILWANSSPAERAKIEMVVRRANENSMRMIEREIGKVRRGKNGSGGHNKVQLIYSSHAHYTARPTEAKETPGAVAHADLAAQQNRDDEGFTWRFDPQLHVHNQIMSMARAPDGAWLTIDTKLLHGVVKYVGTKFQSEIARGLRELGLDVQEEDGAAVVQGFSPEIRQQFSARTFAAEQNAREYARRNDLDFDALDHKVRTELMKAGSAATRLAKGREEDPDAHFEAWKAEAAAFGVDEDHIKEIWSGAAVMPPLSPEQMIEIAAKDALEKITKHLTRDAIIDGRMFRDICAHGTVMFSKLKEEDIEKIMLRAASMKIKVHGIETDIKMFRNADGAIRFSTAAQIAGEKLLFEICQKSTSNHMIEFGKVKALFDPRRMPNEGQLKAIVAIAEGCDITIVEGAAGVGKTTLLQAPIGAYREAGYTVIGLSIANRTAKALVDAGIDDEKCQSIEAFVQGIEAGRIKLSPNTLVIIDEFSQVDIRRGAAVFDAVQKAGGKLVCLGDEFQAAAIDSGSAMRMSKSALDRNVVKVTQTVRQQGEAAEIAAAFRKGGDGVAAAIEKKIKNGDFLYSEGGREGSVTAIIDKWVELGGLNGKCSISAPTNADVMAISRGMRGKIRTAGKLGNDVARISSIDVAGNETKIEVAIGDKLMLYKKTQGVSEKSNKKMVCGYNGSIVTLLDIDPMKEEMTVKTATDTVFRVPYKNIRDKETGALMIGYGYALTIDKAQGITSDNHINALLGGTAIIDAKKFYVNESRHRHRCVTMIDKEAELDNIKRKLAIGEKLEGDTRSALVAFSTKNIERCALKENATDFIEAGDVEHLNAATFANLLAKVSAMPEEVAKAASNNVARATRRAERAFASQSSFMTGLSSIVKKLKTTVEQIRDYFVTRPDGSGHVIRPPVGIDR